MPHATSLRRLSTLLACFALAAALLALAGCDTAGPTQEEAEPSASEDGLRLAPIPSGARLLPAPGVDSSRSNASSSSASRSSDAPEDASPYGCLISTLDPDRKPTSYRYHDVYVHFPRRVLRAAKGRSAHLKLVVKSKRLYTADREARTKAAPVRTAHCRIPSTPEAVRLLKKRLQRFREATAEEKQAMRQAGRRSAKSHFPTNRHEKESRSDDTSTQAAATAGSNDDLAKYLPDGCKKGIVVGRYREDGSFEFKSATCTQWYSVSVHDPTGGAGNDSPVGGLGSIGGSGGGDGGDRCENNDNDDATSGFVEDDVCGEEVPVEDPIVIHKKAPVYPPVTPDDTDFAPVDTLDQDNFPDCSKPQTGDWETDYCNSIPPNDLQEQQMKDAFDRIEQRGTACEKIAQRGRLYLRNGLFRIYPSPGNAGGWGEVGSVILSDGWLNHFDNYSGGQATNETVNGKTIKRNLDALLVHELDHVMGNGGNKGPNKNHADTATYLTTNQKQCDGLSYTYP